MAAEASTRSPGRRRTTASRAATEPTCWPRAAERHTLVETAPAAVDSTLTNTSSQAFGGTDTLSGFEIAELTGSASNDIFKRAGLHGLVTIDGATATIS